MKCLARLLVITSFFTIIGCANPLVAGPSEQDDTVRIVTAAEARQFAEAYVHAFVKDTPVDALGYWSSTSLCDSAQPVYNEGLAGVTYYECKITSSGKDAGYVLITANGTDLPVPEFSTQGLTFTEHFRNDLGKSDFFLYRYGYLGMRAVKNIIPPSSEGKAFSQSTETLSEVGIQGLSALYSTWGDLSRERGTIPYYSRSSLASSKAMSASLRMSRSFEYTTDTEYAELQHKGPNGYSTPQWNQSYYLGQDLPYCYLSSTTTDGLYPTGCGAVAWGEVLAYWQAFKGKSNLFPGANFNDMWTWCDSWDVHISTTANVILQLASAMNTWWGGTYPKSYGATYITDNSLLFVKGMPSGILYPKSVGYSSTTCNVTGAQVLQWVMYNAVRDAIRADRPPIIAIHCDGNGNVDTGIIPSHYVVVEKAKKGIYRDSFDLFGSTLWWWGWADGTAEMFVNMGWGKSTVNDYRWITTVDVNPYYTPTGNMASPAYVYDCIVQ